jgi:hypothetical protein
MSRLAAFTFILGVALMLAFDATLTRIAGVTLLFAGMGLGAWTIASPEFTREDEPR